MRRIRPYAPLALLASLLALAWLAYLPGLHGAFLFDDYANLPAIGATGPVDTWPTFWRYITSGTADPTGRPLALLSFLVDARDWPAEPRPFKYTNLIVHLLNGALLALLLRQLGHALQRFSRSGNTDPSADGHRSDLSATAENHQAPRIDLAAILGAGFWLLHPLFVSTTLYIVQREAMLPATFTLLGLLLWLHGRTRMLRGQLKRGAAWIVLGLGACTLLALLSKANGILLPAFALVIEYILLRPAEATGRRGDRDADANEIVVRRAALPTPSTRAVEGDAAQVVEAAGTPVARAATQRAYRWLMRSLAWPSTVAVAVYLVYEGWHGMASGIVSIRPWTLGQRLLTEPRVLMDYLGLLWLPRPFTPGLFNDQIQASTSLLAPWTTLPSILAVLALIAGAIVWRLRWPAFALAVLFYFVGQSLESSTVPLELFFEHRNYLPAVLMFWPLALWLCGVTSRAGAQARGPTRGFLRTKIALACVLLLGLATLTHVRAELWGNTLEQALLWATINPESPRAQANAAQAAMGAGYFALAAKRLRPMVAKYPDEVQLAFNLVGAQCQDGNVEPSVLDAAETALRTTRDPGVLLTTWFDRAINQSVHPACPQLTIDHLQTLLGTASENPRIDSVPGRRQDILRLKGRIALARGDADAALADFNRALDQEVRAGVALDQAALLGAAGFPHAALNHLDYYAAEQSHEQKPGFGMPRIHTWVLARQGYWPHELAHLRATLREDARVQDRSRR